MANKKALGRGLKALIPDAPSVHPGNDKGSIQFVLVSQIEPNPFQPREVFDAGALAELSQSIEEKGVIQPITVRRWNEGYQLISGERRLRAVTGLGFERVPAYILEVNSDEEMLELAIIENIHREDLNPIDVANGYKRLIDECRLTQEEVAKKVSKERSTVTNFLRLLKLPRRIQESLQEGELSMGHARALLSVAKSEQQLALWKKIIKNQLSVRKVEELVRSQSRMPANQPEAQNVKSYYIQDVENRLRLRLTTQVRVKVKKKGGCVEVDYYNDDDLERLISVICDE